MAAEERERESLRAAILAAAAERRALVATSRARGNVPPGAVAMTMSDGSVHYWVADHQRYGALLQGRDIYQLPPTRSWRGQAPRPLDGMTIDQLRDKARSMGVSD